MNKGGISVMEWMKENYKFFLFLGVVSFIGAVLIFNSGNNYQNNASFQAALVGNLTLQTQSSINTTFGIYLTSAFALLALAVALIAIGISLYGETTRETMIKEVHRSAQLLEDIKRILQNK
jgi:FtsH-binding integral membrane protein